MMGKGKTLKIIHFQEEVVGLLKDAMGAKAGNTKGFVIDGFPVTRQNCLRT